MLKELVVTALIWGSLQWEPGGRGGGCWSRRWLTQCTVLMSGQRSIYMEKWQIFNFVSTPGELRTGINIRYHATYDAEKAWRLRLACGLAARWTYHSSVSPRYEWRYSQEFHNRTWKNAKHNGSLTLCWRKIISQWTHYFSVLFTPGSGIDFYRMPDLRSRIPNSYFW